MRARTVACSFFVMLLACTGSSTALDDADSPPLPTLPPRPDAREAAGPIVPMRELVFAVTGEVRGEVEACGCPTTPYGGFARRARLVEALRSQGPPVFHVDAGEMLVKGLHTEPDAARRARARAVLDVSAAVGLDAWAGSAVDLMPGGLDALRAAGALAANWGGALPPTRVVDRGGVRVGFLGLGAPPDDAPRVAPVEAARAAIEASPPADVWVALSNLSAADNVTIAEEVAAVRVVFATSGDRLDAPRATRGAPVIEAADRGRYVNVTRVALGTSTDRPWELEEHGPLRDLSKKRAEPGARPDRPDVVAARARAEAALAGRNVVHTELIPLGSTWDGASDADEALTRFRSSLATTAAEAAAARPERSGYAGASACLNCHEHKQRYTLWLYDPHARSAWEALVSRGEADNPDCVACHSTGWGRPGGFGELTPEQIGRWKSVQCEACHGPLAAHPNGSARPVPPGPEMCLGCHDEANSPDFDYASYVTRISCHRARVDTAAPTRPAGDGFGPR